MENKKTFSEWLFDKTGLSFWCVWLEFFKPNRYNWITFSFIQLEFEWDIYCGQFDFTFQLFGFGFRWVYSYKKIEDTKIGKVISNYTSSTLNTRKEEALKVLTRIACGESLKDLILEYEKMDTTITL